MKIGIQGFDKNDLSVMRGIGRYREALFEAIKDHGQEFGIEYSNTDYEYWLIPGYNPFQKLYLKKNVKNIVVIHDLITLKYPKHFPVGIKGKLVAWWNCQELKKVDLVLTDSQTVMEEIIKIYPFLKNVIKVVYPATKKIFYEDNIFLKGEFNQKLPDKYVLYVGDITWNKNLSNLALSIQKADVSIVLVGNALINRDDLNHPWKKDFKRFLSIVNNDPRFIFTGYVSDADLIFLYKQACCVILTSWDEGFGYPWLEGALQKKPVILSNIAIQQEISKNSSYYVDGQNINELAQLICRVVGSSNLGIIERQYKIAQEYNAFAFVKQLVASLKFLV